MKERYPVHLGMCACSRTREYCVTQGCEKEKFEWRYTTEGREEDHLRRVVDLRVRRRVETAGKAERVPRPVTRWLRPERAVAEAWLMNMMARPGVYEVIKLGSFAVTTGGVP